MKQHWLAIVLAVAIGLIVGLPHILIPKIISPQKYDPLQFIEGKGSSITMEEVYTYVPEVREILEGKLWVTDTQVAEYNGQSTPFAGETGLAWIMAGLAEITGSIENAFMLADFLFPAVILLLVYTVVWLFTKNQIVSATCGAVLVIWPELLVLFPYPGALISSLKSALDPRDFLFISRNFHPQLSLPAYLFAFVCLLRPGLENPRPGLLRLILSGLSIGFLFYTYIFNWTAFGLGLGLFFVSVIFLSLKRPGLVAAARPGLNMVRSLSVIFIVAGLVAVPYFLQVWNFRQSGLAPDFFTKLSLPNRGFFDLVARQWVFVLVFLVFNKASHYGRKLRPLQTLLFLCFWIAPLLLPDLMQNVLGRDLEGKHWVRRIGYPMSIMGLGLIAGEIKRKWVNLTVGLILLSSLAYGIAVQVNMSSKAAFAYAIDKNKQELYELINTKFPPGSAIASLDWETVVNIPAKTQGFNFSPIGMRTIAPTAEALDRFLWTSALYGKSADWVKEAFGENGIGTTRVYYFMHADEEAVFKVQPEKIEEILLRYGEIQQKVLAGEKPPFRLMLQLPG